VSLVASLMSNVELRSFPSAPGPYDARIVPNCICYTILIEGAFSEGGTMRLLLKTLLMVTVMLLAGNTYACQWRDGNTP
jgi:hypothetical protein